MKAIGQFSGFSPILILLLGIYIVSFISCIQIDFPTVEEGDPPTADFTADNNSILPTSSVQFSDLSNGDPYSWWWQFGDGGSSLLQNPEHQYVSLGTYDVSLTVTNDNGSDEMIKSSFIRVEVDMGATGNLTDADGNSYQTIKIGPQWWMAENLRVSKYPSGGSINYIGNGDDWGDLEHPDKGMCYYDYDIGKASVYGALYTWAAATNGVISTHDDPQIIQGVCPTGWHLPGDEEWMQLEINLGMKNTVADDYGYRGTNEGSKMAGGANLWLSGALVNDAAFGSSGMNIRPFGYQSGGGASQFSGESAYFWTATAYGNGSGKNAWSRRLLFDQSTVYRDFGDYTNGMSVRCVKN
jgi:uncharacterized protein (TIGR02145 family)